MRSRSGLAVGGVVRVDEGEAPELVLIDGAHYLVVDGRQNGVLLRELAVEIQRVPPIFL